VLLVASATMPGSNATGIVAPAGPSLLRQQGLVRRAFVQIRIDYLDDETPAR